MINASLGSTSMERVEPILIPPPSEIRQQLARNLRENRILRSLLRVSERIAEQPHPLKALVLATDADRRQAASP
jgi:hypothetical protein